MSWNANKPADNESPALAPQQIRRNWSRLESMIEADHVFNATSGGSPDDSGYHKIVRWTKQGTDPTAVTGYGKSFSKDADLKLDGTDVTTSHLFHKTTDGTTERTNPISPVPIMAYVNFNGIGTPSIRSQYNVDSVTRLSSPSTGHYRITFATALPSNAYAVSITGMQSASDSSAAGYVQSSTTYGDIVKVGSIDIRFENLSSSNRDVLMGSVIIFGG